MPPPASNKPPVSLFKNAASAPMVFFDSVPSYGTLGGVIEVEIAARVLVSRSDGTVGVEVISAGHLRCGIEAAASLRDTLDRALTMHADTSKARTVS